MVIFRFPSDSDLGKKWLLATKQEDQNILYTSVDNYYFFLFLDKIC